MAFSLRKRALSFRYAFDGVVLVVRTQHNMWIHVAATVVVMAAGAYCSLSRMEWIAITLTIALVWIAEALNTAIELVGDALRIENDPLIGKAKDVGAAAVLFAAVASIVTGLLVFVPHVFQAV